jgi:pyrimidine-nucleoside phosphorylase
MNFQELIEKKRDGKTLSRDEIENLVQGIVSGEVPDYQISAWAMAVYFQGMTEEETRNLAIAMSNSGDVIDLTGLDGIPVDKHSTGGVGDKTTLVAVPLAAAAGVPVANATLPHIMPGDDTACIPAASENGLNECISGW